MKPWKEYIYETMEGIYLWNHERILPRSEQMIKLILIIAHYILVYLDVNIWKVSVLIHSS